MLLSVTRQTYSRRSEYPGKLPVYLFDDRVFVLKKNGDWAHAVAQRVRRAARTALEEGDLPGSA